MRMKHQNSISNIFLLSFSLPKVQKPKQILKAEVLEKFSPSSFPEMESNGLGESFDYNYPPMIVSYFQEKYLHRLKIWTGFEINQMEDFDSICQSDVEFIEILLIGEEEFCLNMLDNTISREDFSTIKDFLSWALTNPVLQSH